MRRAVIVTLLVAMYIAIPGVFTAPDNIVMAQTPTPVEPDFPLCPAGTEEVLRFGPGELVRTANLEDSFNFNVPADLGPEGQILVWQGEGHLWDLGCTPGPGNDGGAPSCDQNQPLEVIVFSMNGTTVGQFDDHSPADDDNNFFYTFDLSNLAEGDNTLVLQHLNQGTGQNSVFYKGLVCAQIDTTPPPSEGCTHGFWKNHLAAWSATGYSTSQTLESVFNVPDALGLDNNTLLEALDFGGGPNLVGAAKILFRDAVAALLNAANPDINYPRTEAAIIADVNAALATGSRPTVLALASQLNADNSLGCPIDGKESTSNASLAELREAQETDFFQFIPLVRQQ